jgi:hypothetical protein
VTTLIERAIVMMRSVIKIFHTKGWYNKPIDTFRVGAVCYTVIFSLGNICLAKRIG